MNLRNHNIIHINNLVYLIAEQDASSEQALNSKVRLAHFSFSAYEVSNKWAVTKQQIVTCLLAACSAIRKLRVPRYVEYVWLMQNFINNTFKLVSTLWRSKMVVLTEKAWLLDYRTRAINHRGFYSNITILAMKLPHKKCTKTDFQLKPLGGRLLNKSGG